MVAGGAGVTLLPTLAVSTENRRGNFAVLPFAKPRPGRTLVLAYRQASPARETLGTIAATMRKTLQKNVTA
jgi:LysR family hydrogen peroxide-inducible transcriptional activator